MNVLSLILSNKSVLFVFMMKADSRNEYTYSLSLKIFSNDIRSMWLLKRSNYHKKNEEHGEKHMMTSSSKKRAKVTKTPKARYIRHALVMPCHDDSTTYLMNQV